MGNIIAVLSLRKSLEPYSAEWRETLESDILFAFKVSLILKKLGQRHSN